MVAMAVTLNVFEGHLPVADVFTCNPSNICAAFYTISTDRVFAWFLWISRAFCSDSSLPNNTKSTQICASVANKWTTVLSLCAPETV